MRVCGGEEVEGNLRGENFLRERGLEESGKTFLENAESWGGVSMSLS